MLPPSLTVDLVGIMHQAASCSEKSHTSLFRGENTARKTLAVEASPSVGPEKGYIEQLCRKSLPRPDVDLSHDEPPTSFPDSRPREGTYRAAMQKKPPETRRRFIARRTTDNEATVRRVEGHVRTLASLDERRTTGGLHGRQRS